MKKYSELILGIIILLLGIVYFVLTGRLPNQGSIDSRFLPNVLSLILFILAFFQIMRGIKDFKEIKEEEVKAVEVEEKLDYFTVFKILVLIILYIGLLKSVGFILCTLIFLFLTFIILRPLSIKKDYILYLTVSVLATLIIYFIFREGLNLNLPSGIL